jgi:hypothetical protein
MAVITGWIVVGTATLQKTLPVYAILIGTALIIWQIAIEFHTTFNNNTF